MSWGALALLFLLPQDPWALQPSSRPQEAARADAASCEQTVIIALDPTALLCGGP